MYEEQAASYRYEGPAVSIKAIILGIIAAVVVNFVVGFVFGFFYGFIVATRGGEVSPTTMARDPLFQGACFGIGLFSTFVGGWVAGKTASREEALNGLLTGMVATALVCLGLFAARSNLPVATWTIFPTVLAQCPLMVLGGLCAGALKNDHY
jgi:hypothetical protein